MVKTMLFSSACRVKARKRDAPKGRPGEGEFDMRFELGGRGRGVPVVRSQLVEPVQKVRHERGQPRTEWPRQNLQTEVVDST